MPEKEIISSKGMFSPAFLCQWQLPSLSCHFNGSKILLLPILTCSQDEATDGEIDALRTAMKCIIDFNLESQFPPEDIEKRIVELEKLRAERRSSVPGPKKQVWHQNKNKRLRTEVSTVEPFDIPVFTPSGQYETSYLSNGGPRQFASSGNRSRNNLRTRQGFAGNHYLYHS